MKNTLERFLHSQSTGAIILFFAAILAFFWANSPWSNLYYHLSHLDLGIYFHGQQYHLSLGHWVKDGLMTIFFFVVGLEIKREVVVGELSDPRKMTLPIAAALGGSICPALIYYFFNVSGEALHGWGIPMATDIAFALGILALFGKRVPLGLKIFLTALAIVDDLLAILVIAFFYTASINISALILAIFLLGALSWVVRRGIHQPGIHLPLAISIWLCILLSGIHATIAGVLIAMVYPVRASIKPEVFFAIIKKRIALLEQSGLTEESMIDNKKQLQAINTIYVTTRDMIPAGIALEDSLHSVQAFVILPLFALFSAGVTVNTAMFSDFTGTISLGIILGLLLGKQVGILGASFVVIKLGLAKLDPLINLKQIWGVSLLAGIGFTMSIFIAELAFTQESMINEAKLAIFVASILSAVLGAVVLHKVLPPKP